MELRQKYGGRVKGTPNKISSEVKSKLQLLIDLVKINTCSGGQLLLHNCMQTTITLQLES